MAKSALKTPAGRNGRPLKEQPKVSELGRELDRLRARYVASGGKLLNRRELEREIAERRGLK
jgi:hypothetical protein